MNDDEILYGHQTQLAVDNFSISGEPVPPPVIEALVSIKAAAAIVNARHPDLTGVDEAMAEVIVAATDIVLEGDDEQSAMIDQFPVDVFQTGSGTSTNMNVNEVLATLAARELGREVHPNDHVNASQSTNDTFPSAIRIAALMQLRSELFPALEALNAALEAKAGEFAGVVKAGRTHLMDATPITLGQEFGGYRAQITDAVERLHGCEARLGALAIGGTAVGNGLNAPPRFGSDVAAVLCDRLHVAVTESEEHFSVQGAQDALVELSAQLRGAAVALFKVANDLRWLASGPRAGLAEISIPPLQAGSSIMPGKVNPVICEVAMQVAAQVFGNDATIAFAGTQGNFELNTFLPVIARNLMDSISLLAAATGAMASDCVERIVADEQRCRVYAEATLSIVTALNTTIGYDAGSSVVKEALETGATVRDVVLARGLLDEVELDDLLDVDVLAAGGAESAQDS